MNKIKTNENTQKKNQDYYRLLLSDLAELIFVFDRNFRIQYFNKPFMPRTGIKREDLIGCHCYQCSHAFQEPCESHGEECVLRKVFESGQPNSCLHEHRAPDGSKIWVDILLSPMKDQNGKVENVVAAIREVTDRLDGKEALIASDERYRILAEQVADAVMLVQRGKLSFVNRAFLEMFDFKAAEDVIGEDVEILGCPALKKHFRNALSLKSKNNLLQFHCSLKNKRQFWLEARHNIITWEGHSAILATLRDITASKHREISIQKEREELVKENITLRKSMKYRYKLGDLVGKSEPMQKVYDLIIRAASLKANVVILGESGTGKELVARTIHQISERRGKPFIPVNCGAIPENLFESEFFGYKKGAFSGANYDKPGLFDLGHGGIMFLDEVGELGVNMQVKLLRAIEGNGYTPVGGKTVCLSDVFVIAASNRNLSEMINHGSMRTDFFYRIHVILIRVPPLRDRKEDIPMLIEHFLKSFRYDKKIKSLPETVMQTLYDHEWPGNVRELQNVLQQYLTINRIDFIPAIQSFGPGDPGSNDCRPADGNLHLRTAVEAFEKNYLLKTLHQNRWQRGITADQLKIPPRTLYRKMKKYRIV